MSEMATVSGQVVAKSLLRYGRQDGVSSERAESLAGEIRSKMLTMYPASKEHWIDVYGRRAEDAEATGRQTSADLVRAVAQLKAYVGTTLGLIMIQQPDATHFIWVDPDSIAVAAWLLALPDQRSGGPN